MEYPWPELPPEDRRTLAECDEMKERLMKAGRLKPSLYTTLKKAAIKDGRIEELRERLAAELRRCRYGA